MQKFDPSIDIRAGWREYVQFVQEDRKFRKMWPNLAFNEETWDQDLRDHIIARRRRYFDGSEAKEREAAEVGQVIFSLNCTELTLL